MTNTGSRWTAAGGCLQKIGDTFGPSAIQEGRKALETSLEGRNALDTSLKGRRALDSSLQDRRTVDSTCTDASTIVEASSGARGSNSRTRSTADLLPQEKPDARRSERISRRQGLTTP